MSNPFLSKSKYLIGLQCPKLLWTHYNAKDELPPVDAATQAIFDQGHEVGELATTLYPDGLEVKWDQGFDGVIAQSLRLLEKRKPLFEAGFRSNNTYARVDILDPRRNGKWDLIEVKSSAEVKEVNYIDVAFQKYCYEGASVPIGRCFLMHINNEYVRNGKIDPEELFIKADITAEVDDCLPEIPAKVSEMLKVIRKNKCPVIDIGGHCDDPYSCVLKDKCWDHVWSRKNTVFDVGYLGQKAFDLYSQGIISTNDIPRDFKLQDRHRVQIKAARTGRAHIESGPVRAFLDELVYPLYFLDFETFGTAIPLLDGVKPYQQVPFQFSLHIVSSPQSKPVHHSWLWDGDGDPRAEMLASLKALLGDHGSIVAYNAGFETHILSSSAEYCHGYRGWMDKIHSRIVDLLGPFRSFSVYYPQQAGSTSMKAVLPALTGKGYDDMAISNGGQASQEFMNAMFTDMPAKDRQKIRKNLEEYCGLDTSGMIDIIVRLTALS